MAARFHVSVLTAEGALYQSDRAEFVVLPAAEGELGVLDRHVPLVALLKPGPMTVTQEGGDEEVLYVSGGFVDISRDAEGGTTVTVLADSGERAHDIDEAAAGRLDGGRRSCSPASSPPRTTPRRRPCWSAPSAGSGWPRSASAAAHRAASARCADRGRRR